MKKIVLKTPSSGTPLTDNELKAVMGGVSAVISCTCDFQMKNGVWSGFEDLPITALQSKRACESACTYACVNEVLGCESVVSSNYSNPLSN